MFLDIERFRILRFGSRSAWGRPAWPACPMSTTTLLAQREIRLGIARNYNRFRLRLRSLVPRRHRVLSVGYVLDLVSPAAIRLREVGSRDDNKVAAHFRVNVAQNGSNARLVEFETALFALRPGS